MQFAALAASVLAVLPLASARTDCSWRYNPQRNFNYYTISTDFGGQVPANFCRDVWHQFDFGNPEGYCMRTVDASCNVTNGVGTLIFLVAIECKNSKIEHGLSLFVPPSEAVCKNV